MVAGPGGRRCVHKTRLSAFDELDDEAEVRNYSFPNSFTQENHFFAIMIEHIENQTQLVREINGVLKPGETLLVNTPNVLNVMSRLRFLFTGFLRGRVRPGHYMSKPGARPISICYILRTLLSPVPLWFQNCRTQKNSREVRVPVIYVALLAVDVAV